MKFSKLSNDNLFTGLSALRKAIQDEGATLSVSDKAAADALVIEFEEEVRRRYLERWRKAEKRKYKDLHNFPEPEDEMPHLLNYGVRYSEEGETFRNWWLFDLSDQEKAEMILMRAGYSVEGFNLQPGMYDCTGEAFAGPVRLKKVSNNRVLATQRGGFDV